MNDTALSAIKLALRRDGDKQELLITDPIDHQTTTLVLPGCETGWTQKPNQEIQYQDKDVVLKLSAQGIREGKLRISVAVNGTLKQDFGRLGFDYGWVPYTEAPGAIRSVLKHRFQGVPLRPAVPAKEGLARWAIKAFQGLPRPSLPRVVRHEVEVLPAAATS